MIRTISVILSLCLVLCSCGKSNEPIIKRDATISIVEPRTEAKKVPVLIEKIITIKYFDNSNKELGTQEITIKGKEEATMNIDNLKAVIPKGICNVTEALFWNNEGEKYPLTPQPVSIKDIHNVELTCDCQKDNSTIGKEKTSAKTSGWKELIINTFFGVVAIAVAYRLFEDIVELVCGKEEVHYTRLQKQLEAAREYMYNCIYDLPFKEHVLYVYKGRFERRIDDLVSMEDAIKKDWRTRFAFNLYEKAKMNLKRACIEFKKAGETMWNYGVEHFPALLYRRDFLARELPVLDRGIRRNNLKKVIASITQLHNSFLTSQLNDETRDKIYNYLKDKLLKIIGVERRPSGEYTDTDSVTADLTFNDRLVFRTIARAIYRIDRHDKLMREGDKYFRALDNKTTANLYINEKMYLKEYVMFDDFPDVTKIRP